MSEWQPIESAPRNPAGEMYGPEILVVTDTHAFEVARFGPSGLSHGCWKDTYDNRVNPTHWMPIPEPPK